MSETEIKILNEAIHILDRHDHFGIGDMIMELLQEVNGDDTDRIH